MVGKNFSGKQMSEAFINSAFLALSGGFQDAGVVTIKKICDGLDITIQEFFADPIFADLEPEL
jgi:hypothetical protein